MNASAPTIDFPFVCAALEANFVDLNRDDVTRVEKFADHKEIYLPNSALGADLVVSLAKMKTHHWAGTTLSMKNFFGLVPGAVYGWPKNFLHMTGIPTSILELNRIFRKTFAIVDGIILRGWFGITFQCVFYSASRFVWC